MPSKKWISTTALAKELGVHPKFLRENRLKLFTAAHHYRIKNPLAWRPTYTWHLERCKALLDEATEKAANIEASQQPAKKGRGVQMPFIEGVKPYEID